MYNTNGDKSVVACRNNLETAYLWIIETAKTTDVHKNSELCDPEPGSSTLKVLKYKYKYFPLPK